MLVPIRNASIGLKKKKKRLKNEFYFFLCVPALKYNEINRDLIPPNQGFCV